MITEDKPAVEWKVVSTVVYKIPKVFEYECTCGIGDVKTNDLQLLGGAYWWA